MCLRQAPRDLCRVNVARDEEFGDFASAFVLPNCNDAQEETSAPAGSYINDMCVNVKLSEI